MKIILRSKLPILETETPIKNSILSYYDDKDRQIVEKEAYFTIELWNTIQNFSQKHKFFHCNHIKTHISFFKINIFKISGNAELL